MEKLVSRFFSATSYRGFITTFQISLYSAKLLKKQKTLKPALERAGLQGFIYLADCHLSLIQALAPLLKFVVNYLTNSLLSSC